MPNWCYTRYVFHGNKNEIEDFHKKIDEWTSKTTIKNDFGDPWLGHILNGAGLGDRIDSGDARLRCRGSMTYLEDVEHMSDEESIFCLDTETAWAPMALMWKEVIQKLGYTSVGFSFEAEEPGCELYQKYDPYGDFPEDYYVDSFLGDGDDENEAFLHIEDVRYYETDEKLKADLQKVFGPEAKEMNLLTLIEKIHKYPFKDEDSFIRVHTYERLWEGELY